MSLPPRDKQQLYHSLAELLRAGITFPAAIGKLQRTAPASTRKALATIRENLDAGRPVAEACAAASPQIGAMEAAVLTAVERAGKLDRGLDQLSAYFAAVATTRATIQRKLAYPIFLLVFGATVLNLPKLFTTGTDAFLTSAIGTLLAVAALGALLYLALSTLLNASVFSTAADSILRALPLVGPMHRAFATARFCLTLELQLEAGVNAIGALGAAGSASRSASIRRAAKRAAMNVTAGGQMGDSLAECGSFDSSVVEGIMVGEESGQLDKELRHLTIEQQALAMARLEAIAEWLPRMIYLGVLLYLGWTIVSMYRAYLEGAMKLMEDV